MYYYSIIEFVRSDAILKSDHFSFDRIDSSSHSKKIINLMFSKNNPNEIINDFVNLVDEICLNLIAKFDSNSKKFNYDTINFVSNFLLKFKEILLVMIIKIRNTETKISMSCDTLIEYMKSKIAIVESAFNTYCDSIINLSDEHLITIKDFKKWFNQLNSDLE